MSVTISSPQEICNSSLNISVSKQLYSFPRAERFEQLHNNSYCKEAYYDVPGALSRRTTTLGYGKKMDLAQANLKTPAPNAYTFKGETELSKEKNKGFQFGVSRDHMTQQSIFGTLKEIIPGPGKYNQKSTLSDIKYSMRIKPEDTSQKSNKIVPGPGQYSLLPAISPKGQYNLSKFKNSGACIINPKTRRFPESYGNDVPGPGQYSIKNLTLQKDGQYFINGFVSSPSVSFPHQKRPIGKSTQQDNLPGPGQYRIPSEFGYYEAKKRMVSLDDAAKL